MNKYFISILSVPWIICIGVAEEKALNANEQMVQQSHIEQARTIMGILIEKLRENQISVDAAWELFASISTGARNDKLLAFLNVLGEAQKVDAGRRGYRTNRTGPFLRDCSVAIKLDKTVIIDNYTYKSESKDNDNNDLLIDARKLFLELSRGDTEKLRKSGSKTPLKSNPPADRD